MGVAYVTSALSKPPFEVAEWRRPTIRPSPSTMREPESPLAENTRPLVVIVDGQLNGLLLGVVVANKRLHACGASDGEVSSVTVFDDDEAGLVVVRSGLAKSSFETMPLILSWRPSGYLKAFLVSLRGYIITVSLSAGILVPE